MGNTTFKKTKQHKTRLKPAVMVVAQCGFELNAIISILTMLEAGIFITLTS